MVTRPGLCILSLGEEKVVGLRTSERAQGVGDGQPVRRAALLRCSNLVIEIFPIADIGSDLVRKASELEARHQLALREILGGAWHMTLSSAGRATVPYLPILFSRLKGFEDPARIAVGLMLSKGRQEREQPFRVPRKANLKFSSGSSVSNEGKSKPSKDS